MMEIQMMRFRAALQAKRQELANAIRAQTSELAIRESGHDPIDQLQSMNHRDEAALAVQWLSRTLSDVDSALRAMSGGRYGDCAECGEPISLKRLEAIPWASHCVGCQEFMERRDAAQAAGPAWEVLFSEERRAA